MLKAAGITFGVVLFATSVQAVSFHPISSISSSTQATDLNPASNLIQGSGVGFDSSEPHDKSLSGTEGDWVTDAPGGFPSDYFAATAMPVLTLDLGQDTPLSEISVWGFLATNASGVSMLSLQFATEAEGPGGFGTSIGFNPSYAPTNDDVLRQSFAFGQTVLARYVEFTATDNFFVAPGDGSGGELSGGNRVGLGEIAFAVPEPTTFALMGLGLAVLLPSTRRDGRRRLR